MRTAAILGEVADLLRGLAEALLSRAEATPDAVRWVRSDLVASPAVVVAEAIRLAAARVVGSARADRRGWASLRRVTECIRGEVHNRKVFEFGGVRIEVKGTAVHLHRTEPGPSDR